MPRQTKTSASARNKTTRKQRKFETPRWRDEGQLLPNSSKVFVRSVTEKSSGRRAVIKHVTGSRSQRTRQRFYDEAMNMQRMTGTRGILPVWDIDDSRTGEPRWYVMPQAGLLNDALGDDATLRDIVEQVVILADVLALLADQDIYHRDIKPQNLFWWNDGTVLADFGIAAWGTFSSRAHEADLTLKAEKLGPANFIAPEMRYSRPSDRGKLADVYSLAKTLFVLALPRRGPYPPDGTHHAEVEEFSFWETGGGNSLPELRNIIEAATEYSPHNRLSMAQFRDELTAWLDRHADVQFRTRGDRSRIRFGWEAIHGRSERYRRDLEATRIMMRHSIRSVSQALTGETDPPSEELEGAGDILGGYFWEPNTEDDGYMPDGTIWMATSSHEGRRIIFEAILDDGAVCFIAESQKLGPPLSLEKSWGPTGWMRARMPRTANLVESLAEDVEIWLASSSQSKSK